MAFRSVSGSPPTKQSTYDIVFAYAELTRMHMWPLGSILVFWPFAYGLLMVSMNTYQQNSLRSVCVDSIIYAIAATILHSQACIYNDICDQRLDGKVERTKDRPLVSGRVSLDGAWFLLIALVLAGLYVLSFVSYRAVWWTAVDLLTLNAIYPFMKRYTWWPSLFLGFAHEWGILVSWLSASGPTDMRPLYLMYAGLVCWTVYYDSIYACQDRTDDVKAGIKSTALLFGPRVKPAVRMFAVAFVGLMTLAGVLNGNGAWFFVVSCGGAACHLLWQQHNWNVDDPTDCLTKFKSNGGLGGIIWLGLLFDYLSKRGHSLLSPTF